MITPESNNIPTLPKTIVESNTKKIALYEGKREPQAKIVKTQFDKERPIISFDRLTKYFDLTPQLQNAIGNLSELITGTDLVINTKSDEAKEFLDEWVRRSDFYTKFEGLVTTWLVCGNALLEKLDHNEIEDVMEVDMTTVVSKKRDEVGRTLFYEQRQLNGKIQRIGDDSIERFIEFNLSNYSRKDWANSVFHSLAVPRTTGYRTTPPLVEVLWGMEDAMQGIITNNAYPITTITYPGANDEYLEKEAERWRRYKPGDKRVQKIKPEIEFFETSPASKYTDYVNHIEKAIEQGSQFPLDIMTGDFTSRASSETTENIVQKRVRGWQRYLCNKLKFELFNIILEQNGYNPEEEELEVSFTTEEIKELTADQVKDRVQSKIWTVNEAREWDRKNLGVELPDDSDIEAEREEQKQLQQQKMDKDVDKLQKKVETLIIKHNLREEDEKRAQRLERKIDLIKEANEKKDKDLAEKRMKQLMKMMEKVIDG